MTPASDAIRYRWRDLPQDHPLELLDRRRIVGRNVMLYEIVLGKGCHVPTHAHENEQFALVTSGEIRFGIGAEGSPERREMTLTEGEVLHIPSNVPHSAVALEESIVIDIFSPPSEQTGIDRG